MEYTMSQTPGSELMLSDAAIEALHMYRLARTAYETAVRASDESADQFVNWQRAGYDLGTMVAAVSGKQLIPDLKGDPDLQDQIEALMLQYRPKGKSLVLNAATTSALSRYTEAQNSFTAIGHVGEEGGRRYLALEGAAVDLANEIDALVAFTTAPDSQ